MLCRENVMKESERVGENERERESEFDEKKLRT
jgi:hypothetical protein